MLDKNIRKVAIVGSGLAGITLAHRLQDDDCEVTLFEKSRGPGGRLAAKRVEGGSVDIGAQYFTIRNSAFRTFLEERTEEGSLQPWRGRFVHRSASGEWQEKPAEVRYVGTPRMSALSRSLARNLTVHAQCRISRLIQQADGRWFLEAGDAQQGPFDAVLLTAPPAQCRELLVNSGLERLTQEFSEEDFAMEPCWAVAVQYASSLGLEADGASFEATAAGSPALSWVARDSGKPGRSAPGEWWVLHGAPGWSHQHQDDTPEAVTQTLLASFAQLMDVQVVPETTLAHRWLYARAAAGGPGSIWFRELGVGLAGDWLAGGRVEAAFESAEDLVQRIRQVPGRNE